MSDAYDADYLEQLAADKKKLDPILPVLQTPGVLWHRTSISNFIKIIEEGLFVNTGQFEFTYPQSRKCLGSHLNAVCVFDFNTSSLEEILSQAIKWWQFLTDQGPLTVWIQLDRNAIEQITYIKPSQLTWEQMLVPASDDYPHDYIPNHIPAVEGWCVGNIPVVAFLKIMIVKKDSNYHHKIFEIDADLMSKIKRYENIWAKQIERARKIYRRKNPSYIDLASLLAPIKKQK